MKKARIKLLVVDDDPGTIRLLEKTLQSHGFDVIAAENGKKALKMAKEQLPDLVILDVLMPGFSGGEVAQALLKDSLTSSIPIVFISVILNKKGKKEIEIDGSPFMAIAKPIYQPELLSAIRKSLKSSKK